MSSIHCLPTNNYPESQNVSWSGTLTVLMFLDSPQSIITRPSAQFMDHVLVCAVLYHKLFSQVITFPPHFRQTSHLDLLRYVKLVGAPRVSCKCSQNILFIFTSSFRTGFHTRNVIVSFPLAPSSPSEMFYSDVALPMYMQWPGYVHPFLPGL